MVTHQLNRNQTLSLYEHVLETILEKSAISFAHKHDPTDIMES